MDIKQALKIIKNKEDYIVPNSDFNEALNVIIDFLDNLVE